MNNNALFSYVMQLEMVPSSQQPKTPLDQELPYHPLKMNTIMANVSVDGVSLEDKGEVPVCAKI